MNGRCDCLNVNFFHSWIRRRLQPDNSGFRRQLGSQINKRTAIPLIKLNPGMPIQIIKVAKVAAIQIIQ